jgi:hypothetical protein
MRYRPGNLLVVKFRMDNLTFRLKVVMVVREISEGAVKVLCRDRFELNGNETMWMIDIAKKGLSELYRGNQEEIRSIFRLGAILSSDKDIRKAARKIFQR